MAIDIPQTRNPWNFSIDKLQSFNDYNEPDWQERNSFWDEKLNWQYRNPQEELAIGLFVEKHENGWKKTWALLYHRLGEDEFQVMPVAKQSYLVTPTGSNQTTNGGVDATWNNANNSIEVIAAGGCGGAGQRSGQATGGGGGEYGKTTNFNIASPGTTTFTWQIGATTTGVFGAAAGATGWTVGTKGGDTWWDGATQAGATLGAIGGNGGDAANDSVVRNGGAGGTGGVGTTHNAGGRGGNHSSGTAAPSTGGGGAGGPNGVGNTGVDATTSIATAGGQGDATSGGTGGPGSTSAGSPGDGNAGTELGDSVHGCGGGGGGMRVNNNSAQRAGNGGLYGAGGGGCTNGGSGNNSSTRAQSGSGAQGIIVLTWIVGKTLVFTVSAKELFAKRVGKAPNSTVTANFLGTTNKITKILTFLVSTYSIAYGGIDAFGGAIGELASGIGQFVASGGKVSIGRTLAKTLKAVANLFQ